MSNDDETLTIERPTPDVVTRAFEQWLDGLPIDDYAARASRYQEVIREMTHKAWAAGAMWTWSTVIAPKLIALHHRWETASAHAETRALALLDTALAQTPVEQDEALHAKLEQIRRGIVERRGWSMLEAAVARGDKLAEINKKAKRELDVQESAMRGALSALQGSRVFEAIGLLSMAIEHPHSMKGTLAADASMNNAERRVFTEANGDPDALARRVVRLQNENIALRDAIETIGNAVDEAGTELQKSLDLERDRTEG